MSNQNPQNVSTAKIETTNSPHSADKTEKRDEGKEIINKFGGSVEGAATKMQMEGLIGRESSEDGGESLGYSEDENKKKGDGDIKRKKQDDQDDAQKVRASLASTAKVVTQKAMSRVVKIAIHQEIREVQNNVNRLSRDALDNAYELSEAIKKLKKLKYILKNLAYWTIDFLRSLFDRVKEKKSLYDTPVPQE